MSSRHITRRSPGDPLDHRARPCAQCPWRRDTDLTAFSGADAAQHAPHVACHQDQPGTRRAWRLCAGWLAVVGPHHLGVRVAVVGGGLPPEALQRGPGWPELYDTLDELTSARDAQRTNHGEDGE